MYLVKTPWWLQALYSDLIWRIPTNEKIIYLSFDDGPHEMATNFVLDELAKFNAKASFFCIGKNVLKYPVIYQQIIDEGHAVGNHTHHHANGWEVSNEVYFKEIEQAASLIKSNLFRPPYGRIKRAQINKIINNPYKIIMWSVLSGDFDLKLSPEACCNNLLNNTKSGSIVVFHDSAKAWERMSYALPRVLAHFSNLGYRFEVIPN
jgi:peptidoglycan/xylan/chitin deacetylase (PgdA/CDA1 family)